MKKTVIRILVFTTISSLAVCTTIWQGAHAEGEKSRSGVPQVLYSREKGDVPDPKTPLTVEEFFIQQVRQFETIRGVMEQQMAQNLLPTSPIYQKMLQMNQLNQVMLQEFMALTTGDSRPLAVMMDPTSKLSQQLMSVWQRYEPQLNQFRAELAPYTGAPPVMGPPFVAQASSPGDFHGMGPAGSTPQLDHPPSESAPHGRDQSTR